MEIFISHSGKDRELAQEIVQIVRNTGHSATLHTYEVEPIPITEKIKKAIRNSTLAFILWTSNSQGSEWVLNEIGALSILNKEIIVLLAPETNPPQGMIEGIQYVRLNSQEAIIKLVEFLKRRSLGETVIGVLTAVGLGILAYYYFKK